MGLKPKGNMVAITFDDLSPAGVSTLCVNMIMRTIAFHLEANYERNPYKDIPINENHPIVADLTADIYEKILAKCVDGDLDEILAGKQGDMVKVDDEQLMTRCMMACVQILSNPDQVWFQREKADETEHDESQDDNPPLPG